MGVEGGGQPSSQGTAPHPKHLPPVPPHAPAGRGPTHTASLACSLPAWYGAWSWPGTRSVVMLTIAAVEAHLPSSPCKVQGEGAGGVSGQHSRRGRQGGSAAKQPASASTFQPAHTAHATRNSCPTVPCPSSHSPDSAAGWCAPASDHPSGRPAQHRSLPAAHWPLPGATRRGCRGVVCRASRGGSCLGWLLEGCAPLVQSHFHLATATSRRRRPSLPCKPAQVDGEAPELRRQEAPPCCLGVVARVVWPG